MAPNVKIYAWTDSMVVLAWLSNYPSKWKTFVANRVSQILEKFPRHHWAHVRSADNPADHGSRGVIPSKLIKLQQWWYGPYWLREPEALWPRQQVDTALVKDKIQREQTKSKFSAQAFQTVIEENWLEVIFERKSNIRKIFRVVAFVKRFIMNVRIKEPRRRNTDELTAAEIEDARFECIKWVQSTELNQDIRELRRNKFVNRHSKLTSLAPFIDNANILRVGGRLNNADCEYANKHPIILPTNHIFTERLIMDTHARNLHAGPTLTHIMLRQNYWILNGRSKIRSLTKGCVICVKHSHRTSKQLMGDLPKERVTATRPFENCGIDFAGPLHFAVKKGRGGTNPIKGYLCVFVCLSIKAVHIEPVSDLTSEAFLATLKRFTARRGIPKRIYSDNGTNFIGARRILKEAYDLISNIKSNYIISEYLSSNNIEWSFIPPASPHFGGLWESTVKSVKTHLLKSTKNVNLTFEEMATLTCQIENILNSRPIGVTSTQDEYQMLTPAHFLIGTLAGSIPEKPVGIADSLSSRWQRVQARIQSFWQRYRNEYINNLQQRQKWKQPNINLQVNDVIIIKEDNTPVCKWPIGRIVAVHPGNDNLVRVVTIKTANSILQRPVVKVCKLPIG